MRKAAWKRGASERESAQPRSLPLFAHAVSSLLYLARARAVSSKAGDALAASLAAAKIAPPP